MRHFFGSKKIFNIESAEFIKQLSTNTKGNFNKTQKPRAANAQRGEK